MSELPPALQSLLYMLPVLAVVAATRMRLSRRSAIDKETSPSEKQALKRLTNLLICMLVVVVSYALIAAFVG